MTPVQYSANCEYVRNGTDYGGANVYYAIVGGPETLPQIDARTFA